MLDLESHLPESLWFQLKDRSKTFLICTIYWPPHNTVDFWDKVNICLGNATEISYNIIIVGDLNNDQLNPNNYKFRDIVLMNNMINTINEPTRVSTHSSTILYPIAVSKVVLVHNSSIYELIMI